MSLPLPDSQVDQKPWEVEREGVQRNFETIARAILDTGGQSLALRMGSDVLTWPGGASVSNNVTVTHGLARTVVAAFVTGTGNLSAWSTGSLGATTFVVQAKTVDGTFPALGTQGFFFWLAIG